MTDAIPREGTAAGRCWRVRRAWPASDAEGASAADLEVTTPGIRGVRAGHWSAATGAAVQSEPVDAGLPALTSVAAEGVVVSWRAGRRAVVRAHGGQSFVKVVRRAVSVRAAHERAAGFAEGFALPRVIEQSGDDTRGIVRFTALPGRTLDEIGADPAATDDDVRRAWTGWGDGWLRALAADSAHLPAHTASHEAGVVRTWTAHAARAQSVPTRARTVLDAGERIVEALETGRAEPMVLAHRDLHDKQVLWHDDAGPGLLDLDTASRAEGALDLGNLRAHVAFRVAQGALDASRARAATATIDTVVARAGVDPARLGVYEAATRLRLGCLYLFRPAWRAVATRWLAHECARGAAHTSR